MQINDPFRFIDWDINRFLGIVLSTQIAALVLIWLDTVGYHLPILRPLVCFVYLTFMPGAVVLRAMNVRKLGPVEATLFTIGVSLATVMFLGALLNFIGPRLGLAGPITLLPLAFTLAAFVLLASTVCFLRSKKAGDEPLLDVKKALSPPALLLLILPFLAILGAGLMNLFSDNVLLILMILAIMAIVLLVGFDRLIPKELYPLAIFVVALSLVLHSTLISTYINGWDIQIEKYYATLVLTNGSWDMSIFNVLNAMLSIVMLAPVYSIVTGMSIVWVLKLVYPLLFALVPLGLYEAFRRQSSEKTAFMAAFFFTSLVVFYTEMLQLARQEIAEIFLMLVILLIINRSMDNVKWSFLFILFSCSVIVSHYGLTYIFIASLLVVWAMLFVGGKLRLIGITGASRRLSMALIIPAIVFFLAWYNLVASGNAIDTILVLIEKIQASMIPGFMNPEMVQGIAIIASGGSASGLHRAYVYLMLLTQALVGIGLIAYLFKRDLAKIGSEYLAFSLVMIVLLIAGLTVPFVSSALNTTRLYQISLIFLAIFFVIGWLGVSRLLGRLARRGEQWMPVAFRALALFLALFLAFNTGLVFEVFNDQPTSYSLNGTIDTSVFNSAEVASATWMTQERVTEVVDRNKSTYYLPPIYADNNRLLLFSGQGALQVAEIPADPGKVFDTSFIYLGTYNLVNDKVMVVKKDGALLSEYYDSADAVVKDRGRIYANGGAEIYY